MLTMTITEQGVVTGFDASTGDNAPLRRPFVEQACLVLSQQDGAIPPLRIAPTYWENAAEQVFQGIDVIAIGSPADVCSHDWQTIRLVGDEAMPGATVSQRCTRCETTREVENPS